MILPEFRRKNMSQGIIHGTNAILDVLTGNAIASTNAKRKLDVDNTPLFVIFTALTILATVFPLLLAGNKTRILSFTGIAALILLGVTWFVTGDILAALLIAFFGFIFLIFMASFGGRGGPGGDYGGGGGFSGGGGGFGGGGASGGW